MNFGEYFLATLLGTLPAHIVFAYCADALFNGTMTQGDAVKRLMIVAARSRHALEGRSTRL